MRQAGCFGVALALLAAPLAVAAQQPGKIYRVGYLGTSSPPDPSVSRNLDALRQSLGAAKNRLPTIYPTREFVEAAGLMSYGVDIPAMYRRAAIYVDKILRGAKPADLPVEQPTKFELLINIKAAQALGLTVPPSLLLRAERVGE